MLTNNATVAVRVDDILRLLVTFHYAVGSEVALRCPAYMRIIQKDEITKAIIDPDFDELRSGVRYRLDEARRFARRADTYEKFRQQMVAAAIEGSARAHGESVVAGAISEDV